MAAISSGVARPAVSSITETRYCIWDHLLWFGAPLAGGRSPLLRTPLPRSGTPSRDFLSRTFWYAGCERSDSDGISSRDSQSPSPGPCQPPHPPAPPGPHLPSFTPPCPLPPP